jgi:hypothetical protein
MARPVPETPAVWWRMAGSSRPRAFAGASPYTVVFVTMCSGTYSLPGVIVDPGGIHPYQCC